MSRRAHRIALARASGGADDYHRQLCAVFESWMDAGAPQVQVVCFASAAEFGLPMHRHAEACRTWAMQHGSCAHRALYWAALHRTRSRVGATAQMADVADVADVAEAEVAARNALEPDWGGSPVNESVAEAQPLCRRCERLRLDARCATGHGSLRPLGETQSRSFGAGVICQTREHQCLTCKTQWWQHRSAANLFTGWTINRRGGGRQA